jgi:hypothetical protein
MFEDFVKKVNQSVAGILKIQDPYQEEHACRIKEPKQFKSIRRKNKHKKSNGKWIDYIFGIKDGKSEIQALRYPTKYWSEKAAREHCKEKNGILFEPAEK